MQITGTIVKVLPVESGTKDGKDWKRARYVLATGGQYSKNICFTVFGTDKPTLKEGESVEIDFDIESREYQGKYYTDVKAYKVTVVSGKKEEPKEEVSQVDDSLPF